MYKGRTKHHRQQTPVLQRNDDRFTGILCFSSLLLPRRFCPRHSLTSPPPGTLPHPCGILQSFSSSARSASLRSAFSACTGRKTSSSISMASCSNANGVFPVFRIQTSTLSRESGCFCACNTCSPSHVISHSSHCGFSVADKSFFNLKNPLIFSLISFRPHFDIVFPHRLLQCLLSFACPDGNQR